MVRSLEAMLEPSTIGTANRRRNAQSVAWRTVRWHPARAALWRLVDRHARPGARIAVVGVGNGHDVPLRRLLRRGGRVDLIDLDRDALLRARRRAIGRRQRLELLVCDVTFGRADTVGRAVVAGGEPPPDPNWPAPERRYDLVVADLLFTQLLYPQLVDAGLGGEAVDAAMRRYGQPLTDGVVAWLHAAAPHGRVVMVHDLLGWWVGHPQPFALRDVLAAARRDPAEALAIAQTGDVPLGCDPRAAARRIGAEVLETAFWRWPFSAGVEYLVCATVTSAQSHTC